VDAPTVIYVPATRQHPWQPVHYAEGFAVQNNGVVFDRAELEANQLSMQLDSETELHTIRICPHEARGR
jgi:hypothetical protein